VRIIELQRQVKQKRKPPVAVPAPAAIVSTTYKRLLLDKFIQAFNNSSDGISSKALAHAFQDVDGLLDQLFKECNTSLSTLIFIKKVCSLCIKVF
jgi:hypothetical protein